MVVSTASKSVLYYLLDNILHKSLKTEFYQIYIIFKRHFYIISIISLHFLRLITFSQQRRLVNAPQFHNLLSINYNNTHSIF